MRLVRNRKSEEQIGQMGHMRSQKASQTSIFQVFRRVSRHQPSRLCLLFLPFWLLFKIGRSPSPVFSFSEEVFRERELLFASSRPSGLHSSSDFLLLLAANRLHRYWNLDRDWEELVPLGELKVEHPVLFIGGERNSTVRFANIEAMRAALPKLRNVVLLPGCGRWTQQERPAVVNTEIIDFLRHEITLCGG